MATYFYVIEEQGYSDFCKVGITCQEPYSRLRKLQQGNPRNLRIKYLYIGDSWHAECLESTFKWKNSWDNVGGSRTEWFVGSPDDVKDMIDSIIEENNYKIHEITDPKIVPYNAKSYGSCYMYRNNISRKSVLENAKAAKSVV